MNCGLLRGNTTHGWTLDAVRLELGLVWAFIVKEGKYTAFSSCLIKG